MPYQHNRGWTLFENIHQGEMKKSPIKKSVKIPDPFFFPETSTCIFHKKNNWKLPQHRKHIANAQAPHAAQDACMSIDGIQHVFTEV